MARMEIQAANVIQRFFLRHYYDPIETFSHIKSCLFWREYMKFYNYIPKHTIILTCECGEWGLYEDIRIHRHDFWNGLCFECEKSK